MPLPQLPPGSAFNFPKNYELADEDRFCLVKAYWRFEWEGDKESDQPFYPFIVVHVHQKIVFKLPFLGAMLLKPTTTETATPRKGKITPKKVQQPPASPTSFLCAVDLPDSVILGSDSRSKYPFAKLFGNGRMLLDKQQSLGLNQLRRSMVSDISGDIVPGFPLVVLELPFNQSPHPNTALGHEVHTGWTPVDDMFHGNPRSYLSMFILQAEKLGTTLETVKNEAEIAHADGEPAAWGGDKVSYFLSIA